jgi:hypothetical protein
LRPPSTVIAISDTPPARPALEAPTGNKTQAEIDALQRIGDSSRSDTSNLNNNINRRGEVEVIRNAAESVGWKLPDGTPWYPPNGGAIPGTEKTITLPYEPTSDPTKFITTQPIPNVTEGFATPWFNQPGTGRQWQLPTTPNNLPGSIEKK